LGLTAGLSLGAIVGIVGCEEQMDDVGVDNAAVESENGFATNGFASNGFAINGFATNGFTVNGFTTNGFAMNGFTVNGFATNGFALNGFASNGFAINGFTTNGFTNNGFALNGFTINGLETTNGLSSTSGLMTTPGGREVIKYMVRCAYPSGASLTKQDQYGTSYTFDGALGVAPEMETGTCDIACQERVSAAMLAHVNNSGLHVGIWLAGPDAGIGWDASPNYPYQEGAYFGNMFAPTPKGNYCAGKNLGAGAAKGRMGASIGSSILSSPYGEQWDGVTNQNVPVYCANGTQNYCNAQTTGFTSCQDPSPQTPYTGGHSWTHVVTVWRNFEPTQIYKICNKWNKCLGVAGGSTTSGANIEQRTYASALGQTWQILQVSPGSYKIINRTSGMALDLNGAQFVQRPFTGASSQLVPLTYIASEPGRANIRMASLTNGAMMMSLNGSTAEGALMQAVTGYPADAGSPDGARWSFQPIGLASFDPGRYNRLLPMHAQTKSIDVAYASTTNGTAVQIYDTWNGDPQKFIVAPAGNGNVKFTMKLNTNKCIGPNANGTTSGTQLVVQDCNGSFNQAWMSSEQGAGTGVFAYRNAAAPGLCMDVTGASTANGARMELYTCNGGSHQQFKVLAQ
jgi:hypothetical protein